MSILYVIISTMLIKLYNIILIVTKGGEDMKPNILCVGFAKCGTTTLYDIMKQHPDIYLSGIKEPIYYGMKELVEKKGFEWYENRYYSKRNNKKVIMEINPILGRNVSASQIKADYGNNVKIIFLIRNPIDRLYSDFKMNLLDGTCFSNLSDNLGNSTKQLFDKWIKNNFIFENNYPILKESSSTFFCESGNYYDKIKDYTETFGKDNIKIIFFEDFIKNPKKECLKMFDFINVKSEEFINYNLHSNDGNRLPRNLFTIKANKIWFSKIYRPILIEKIPFISDNMCKFLNFLTWKIPVLFSKKNLNVERMSDESRKILEKYYYNMISNLSDFINLDLFEKWHIKINGNKMIILK